VRDRPPRRDVPGFAMPFAACNALHRRMEAAPTFLPGTERADCPGHQSSYSPREAGHSTHAPLVLRAVSSVRRPASCFAALSGNNMHAFVRHYSHLECAWWQVFEVGAFDRPATPFCGVAFPDEGICDEFVIAIECELNMAVNIGKVGGASV